MKSGLRKLAPVSFAKIKVNDGFWKPRMDVNRTATLPIEYEQCQKTGRIDAFKLDWKRGMPNEPHIFWDSDVAKWIEAAAYSLTTHPDPKLEQLMDEVIGLIAKAQQPDGYLNCHFTVVEPEKRWANLADWHELYCAGHLMEAAVAHFDATGKRTFLDVMCRYADLIARTFGREPGKKRGYCGHPEIELALMKLYRASGEKRYLNLATYFIDERGQQPCYYKQEEAELVQKGWKAHGWAKTQNYAYCQSHKPLREQDEVTGHAVRAMYIYSGMADVATQTNDKALLKACQIMWNHLHNRMLYITGGIGSTQHGEAFTFDYDLPNDIAYCETCAAIGLVFWNHRMLQIDGDAKYADAMERALYNGTISGVSLDGKKFFYANRLASDPEVIKRTGGVQHHFPHDRQEWFGCACCPPNIARMIASIGEYVYSQSRDTAYVHLYVQGAGDLDLASGRVQLKQTTRYPWDGAVAIEVNLDAPAKFALALRVPGWCRKATFKVNGETVKPEVLKGYAKIARTWRAGDTVELDLAMPVERVEANPAVRMDCGCVALQRGPVVYCIEQIDNGPKLTDLCLPAKAKLTTKFEPKLLGGVVTITGTATRRDTAGWTADTLYSHTRSRPRQVKIKAVPYAVWNNRGEGEMLVWVHEA
ncbi:MAG: hypothetical protein A3K19_23000 [Lentisphaerae bacterium RIFOXYB12_FULL_65_16]|nr:MAG: hypothetical protein A3K18_16755 [Lentisphaerae bacterium RIFOXYA12_64_32]OGV90078.1 MAG: hypothetical protein A3K19_23000 [Lentisphaerae bacterium RIFOXYB12_FULL_65_16]